MSRPCVSPSCKSFLLAPVPYCPFCGSSQQKDDPATAIPEPLQRDAASGHPVDVAEVITIPAATVERGIQEPIPETTPIVVVQSRTRQPRWAIVIAACAAMATAFYVYSSSTGAECNSPSRNVLVVLDFTGQASLTTGEIVSRVQSLFDNIRNGERFAIFDTRADAPIFETCFSSLATTARSGERDKLTDTVVQAIAGDAAAAPASFATAPRQKISVKITDLSLTKYLRASENSLHLVSDLLEGSPATFDSLCQPANRAIDNFRLARRGGMEQPAFVHTQIHLHLVPRQDVNPASLNCRDKYWRWLLANASGTGAGMSIAYLPSSIRSSNE